MLFVQKKKSSLTHYENTPIQYNGTFYGCKNKKFKMKKYDLFLFFSKQRLWVLFNTASSSGSNGYPLCFIAEIRKIIYTLGLRGSK